MGCGIAQVSAMAGYKVQIYDIAADRVEQGLATINGNMARVVSSGKLSDEDFERQDAELRSEAIKILEELDRVRGSEDDPPRKGDDDPAPESG